MLSKKVILSVLVVFASAVFSVGGYIVYGTVISGFDARFKAATSSQTGSAISSDGQSSSDYKTLQNKAYGFSYQLPTYWQLADGDSSWSPAPMEFNSDILRINAYESDVSFDEWFELRYGLGYTLQHTQTERGYLKYTTEQEVDAYTDNRYFIQKDNIIVAVDLRSKSVYSGPNPVVLDNSKYIPEVEALVNSINFN